VSEGKEAVYTGQGTRLSERAPWETWDEEWEESIPEDLADEIKAYSEKRYEDGQSSSESQEVLAQLREENDELSEQYQWLTRAEYDDEKAREGRVMSHSEFISLLRKAGIQCFYRQHVHADKAVLYFVDSQGIEQKGPWVQVGYCPELSIMNFDAHGAPLAERRRGWRTPLLQLILASAITEEKADATFGKPKLTAAYSRYNATLYAFRNRNVEKI
jgi:cupin superfamily acireductone dioxygenase involved in methionine salvage